MAVRFDALDDYLYVTVPAAPHTIAFWMKYKGTSTYYRAFLFCKSTAMRVGYDPDVSGGDVAVGLVSLFDGSPTVDVWYYVAHTWTGSTGDTAQSAVFKAAGTEITALTATANYNATGSLYILGGRGPGSETNPYWGNISVADARCWTRVLTASELEAERYSSTVVDSTDLWAQWPLSVHTDLEDKFSTNDFTAGGTLSTESDDPPWAAGAGPNPGSIWPTVTM